MTDPTQQTTPADPSYQQLAALESLSTAWRRPNPSLTPP